MGIENCAHVNSDRSAKRSTPLHVACFYGKLDVARLLLAFGANPQMRNSFDLTPVQEADPSVMSAFLGGSASALTGGSVPVAGSSGETVARMFANAHELHF